MNADFLWSALPYFDLHESYFVHIINADENYLSANNIGKHTFNTFPFNKFQKWKQIKAKKIKIKREISN